MLLYPGYVTRSKPPTMPRSSEGVKGRKEIQCIAELKQVVCRLASAVETVCAERLGQSISLAV